MSPVVAIIIVVIIVAVCCLCCYIASQNNMSDDDVYEEEVITETVVEHHDGGGYNGPPATVYAPGTNPPGTALCNAGHIFGQMYQNPYDDDTATCDNCQQVINWNTGGFHCSVCEVDLCTNCGQGRVKP
jgi:hypothetical protein